MISVDTNILARYLLADDRRQARVANALLRGRQQFTAPPTVFDRVLVKQSGKIGSAPQVIVAK